MVYMKDTKVEKGRTERRWSGDEEVIKKAKSIVPRYSLESGE